MRSPHKPGADAGSRGGEHARLEGATEGEGVTSQLARRPRLSLADEDDSENAIEHEHGEFTSLTLMLVGAPPYSPQLKS